MTRLIMHAVIILLAGTSVSYGQKIDEDRMQRDIAVGENVLGTLIKQELANQRTFFPLEINGSYQAGYGVTFTLPADYTTQMLFTIAGGENVYISGGQSFNVSNGNNRVETVEEEAVTITGKTDNLKDRVREKRRLDMDSIRSTYNEKVIEAAKTFLVDYGDMITQLSPQEKIIITNQGNQSRVINVYFNTPTRTHLAVETSKADLTQYKQGKISRDQALAKIKVLNTETMDTVEPDLELLSSIFSRLYRADLSKTYFTEDNIFYEHLKDYGVIFYMQVFGGVERGYRRYLMPTINLDNIDLETRNKKVTELYPKFEQDLKENILEYGKTLKSLKSEEVLIFQVQVTKCPGCGIPSTLECAIKGSVLKDFSAGKVDKNAAMGKFVVKKGPDQ
jgi:hypothetical protein